MPNFNEVSKREEIVIANIDRTIGRFQARKELAECRAEEEASKVIVKILETTRCEIRKAMEWGTNLRGNISRVINRAIGQFKFREEIATCEVEQDIYKDVRYCLDIIVTEYMKPKQSFPKMWGVCEVIVV